VALGRAYELGRGTPVDLARAYAWYSLAAQKDKIHAQKRLEALGAKLSPDQMKNAQDILAQLTKAKVL
jgi:TPR repeat protein